MEGPVPSATSEAVELTIVIVNWNGGEKLLRCLSSIRASRTTFPVKVIVVDNDSWDGSRELAAAEFPEFLVLNTGANLGFGRGNNFARPFVNTPLVLFLNPDTELFPATLEKAVRSLLGKPRVGILGCQMHDPDGRVQKLNPEWFPTPGRIFLELVLACLTLTGLGKDGLPRQDPCRSSLVNRVSGCFLLARKDVLDEVGWFDDRYFMYAEEVDLCRTVQERGWGIYYEADCAIIHQRGGCTENVPSEFSVLMQQRSTNLMIAKYQGRLGAILHRLAVGVAASMRLVGLGILQLAMRSLGRGDRVLDKAWRRSWLLWQWAWLKREAEIPKPRRGAIDEAVEMKSPEAK